MEKQIEGEYNVEEPPVEGGPWWVGRGSETSHIVMDGEPLCGLDITILGSHVCERLDDNELNGSNLVSTCGLCYSMAEHRGWV